MEIKYDSIVIFVSDINRSKTFYQKFLGLEIKMDMGRNVILENGITLWERPEKHVLVDRTGVEEYANNYYDNFELCFETDNIKDVYNKLVRHNINFLHKIIEEPWGQNTMRLFDPDNNIIEIGESLTTFLNRMKSEGMNIEEIADKTGMQEQDISKLINSDK